MAQTFMLAKRGACLQQRSTLSTSPLQAELQVALGPVTYVDEKSSAPATVEELEVPIPSGV